MEDLQVHHIQPRSRLGDDTPENLIPSAHHGMKMPIGQASHENEHCVAGDFINVMFLGDGGRLLISRPAPSHSVPGICLHDLQESRRFQIGLQAIYATRNKGHQQTV
jgi:hypothetical protein